MPAGVRFRPMAEADFEWFLALSVRCLQRQLEAIGRWDPLRRRSRALAGFETGEIRVIERDGAAIGSAALAQRPGHAEIHSFYLDPAVQGQGLGTAILRLLLAEAGPQPVHLEVLKQSSAARLYERAGFVRAAEQDYDWLYILPALPECT
jgi:RimJ/RimL family protein N-acetyltransferase